MSMFALVICCAGIALCARLVVVAGSDAEGRCGTSMLWGLAGAVAFLTGAIACVVVAFIGA
jgi:hypothetical protein